MPDTATFLSELEGLAHIARQRRLVQLGRASVSDAEAGALLDALVASADAYARSLVVTSLYGSRDVERAYRLLTDPSRLVRRRTARIVPVICDDAQAAEALARCTTVRAQKRLALQLRRCGRVAALDEFFARVRWADEPALIDALPLGSATAVERHMSEIESRGGPTAWTRLAKMHPARFARYVSEALAKTPGALGSDFRFRARVAGAATLFARRDPSAALGLLQQLLERDEDPNGWLVRALVPWALLKHPAETFDAVRARHERGAPVRPPGALGILRLDRVAHRLGVERLQYVVQHAWSTLSDGQRAKRWFLKLSAVERDAVIDSWLAGGREDWGAFLLRHVAPGGPRAAARERAYGRWSTAAQDQEGLIPVKKLQWLPADLRRRQAERHLALPVLSTRADVRNAYASLLPFDAAKTALAPFLGHPEGEELAKAIGWLLGSVQHDEAAAPSALGAVRARKFEQDPVRLAMISALAALPVRCFTAALLDDVGAIVSDALDAADLSPATAAAVERLVVRLFRVDASWGARWLTLLLQKRGSLGVGGYGLGTALLPSDMQRLAPALAELATSWATQERSGALLWLSQSLGLRLGAVPALLDALTRLSREQPFVSVTARALGLLRGHAPARFAELVPELLAADRSYVVVPEVATFLAQFRQDLLVPFLSHAPMTGRFATGRSNWVIRFQRGFGGWTSRLQTLHAQSWVVLLSDQKRDVPTLLSAIHALGALAFAPAELLLPFARDPRQPVRETAVRMLPWLDEGQGVPTLLECLGDDRARWAIYALRQAFAEMSRELVLGHLRAAPTTKVTVAKEVMRLLGELGGQAAFDALLAVETRPDLHRDVRIALLRALWDHLERDQTWPVFERAVTDKDWVVASRLADIPLGRLSAKSQERVIGLLVRVLGRPEPEARLDLLRRTPYLPITDTHRTLFTALVAALGAARPDEARIAAQAVLTRMQPGEVDSVLKRLGELSGRRQLMVELVPAFEPKTYSPPHVRKLAEQLAALLAADPLATVPYLRFASRLFGWKPLVALFKNLAQRNLLHADAMAAAADAIRHCVHPVQVEAALASDANPRLRRLGVEALRQSAAPQHGWTAERRQKLAAYQADADPLVAGAAAYIFPPD